MNKLLARTRIFIVEDHPLVIAGLTMRISLQADWEICGEAATEDEAFNRIRELCPDVVLIDLALKSGSGIELVKRIKGIHSAAKLLIISAFPESLYAERAMRAGAHGYLNKQRSNEELIDAIRTIVGGERYLSSAMTNRMVSQALGQRTDIRDPREQLTDRELEVFRLIGAGLTSGAIATELFLSTHTIDTHRENIKRKLGLKTGAELNRFATLSMIDDT